MSLPARCYADPETGHLERLADKIVDVMVDAMLPARMVLHEDGRIETMPSAPPHPVLAETLQRLEGQIAEIRHRRCEAQARQRAPTS